jgi:hypothetical protein
MKASRSTICRGRFQVAGAPSRGGARSTAQFAPMAASNPKPESCTSRLIIQHLHESQPGSSGRLRSELRAPWFESFGSGRQQRRSPGRRTMAGRVALLVARKHGYSWGISQLMLAAVTAKSLVESGCAAVIPPRNEKVVGSIPIGGLRSLRTARPLSPSSRRHGIRGPSELSVGESLVTVRRGVVLGLPMAPPAIIGSAVRQGTRQDIPRA